MSRLIAFARAAAASAVVAALAGGPQSAWAGSTFFFDANQSYRSAGDSPFVPSGNTAGGSFVLENFENGLSTQGMTIDQGHIKGPGAKTDSVDGDDGNVNNHGNNGHSFTSGSSKKIDIHFDSVGGNSPNFAGLVFTDGKHDARVTFKAWDAMGNFLGKIKVRLGDLVRTGTAGEDRFFGLTNDSGISRIQIASNYAGFEIDHVQFGYSFAVVPVPPALGLGAAGLAGLGVWRRCRGGRASRID